MSMRPSRFSACSRRRLPNAALISFTAARAHWPLQRRRPRLYRSRRCNSRRPSPSAAASPSRRRPPRRRARAGAVAHAAEERARRALAVATEDRRRRGTSNLQVLLGASCCCRRPPPSLLGGRCSGGRRAPQNCPVAPTRLVSAPADPLRHRVAQLRHRRVVALRGGAAAAAGAAPRGGGAAVARDLRGRLRDGVLRVRHRHWREAARS